MAHPTSKIKVTWDNRFTEQEVKNIKRNVINAYPNTERFFTIINYEDYYQLVLTHHDFIVIDNLYIRVNYEISNCTDKLTRDEVFDFCSVRLQNCLKNAGFNKDITFEKLSETPSSELLKYRNFGKRSIIELKELMKERDIKYN
jgi:hypothetical protein